MLTLTSLALCTILTPAAESDHPVVATVRATIQDASKPFVLVVHIKVKDGAGPKFERAFAEAAKTTRKESGNRVYDLSRSTKNPNEYLLYERWDNLAALAAHVQTPHFQKAVAAIGEIGDGPPDIRVHAAVGD
jgi:quinol monooxygenase YgiN